MPDGLTPDRLRALIAAAKNDHHHCGECGTLLGGGWDLVAYCFNNAPALSDALSKARLLERARAHGRYRCEFGVGYVAVDSIDALRAAKEDADA